MACYKEKFVIYAILLKIIMGFIKYKLWESKRETII